MGLFKNRGRTDKPPENTEAINIPEENKGWDKEKFINELAHSVRMPLAVISGYGDLIRKGKYGSEAELKEYLGTVCKNIEHLNIALQLVLTEERYEKPEDYEQIDVVDIVRSVAGFSQKILAKKNINISVNCVCNKLEIMGSKNDLIRVFYNLIENSYRYMREGDRIVVTIDRSGDNAMIVFRDNGICTETDNNEHGNGTGHKILRNVIEMHGGTVGIKKGSGGYVVYITIPART